MREFQEEMNRVRGRFGAENGPAFADSYPPMNIWADKDRVYAEAELPGMQLDHLEIYVTEGNQLTIQGERRQRELDKGVRYGQERGFGQFSRTIMLPAISGLPFRARGAVRYVAQERSRQAQTHQCQRCGERPRNAERTAHRAGQSRGDAGCLLHSPC